MSVKLLFLAGSARKNSTNKKLAYAASEIATQQGAVATFVDLKDYAMPIYDGDLQDSDGLPQSALELKKLFVAHDGIFIASPEYNGSYSALLKNTIDWVSRQHPDQKPAEHPFRGKAVAIASATPGALGGVRGLVALRLLMGNLSMHVVPEQLGLARSNDAFDATGKLGNQDQIDRLFKIVTGLMDLATKLK